MGWSNDPNVLDGPVTPFWGCSKCGADKNYASRVKCRCGAGAPTRVIQAAKREAAAFKLQPKQGSVVRPRGKWARGPPKSDDNRNNELAELRAENERLRGSALVVDGEEEKETVGDERPDLDIEKIQLALNAIIAAFGENSDQAKQLATELDELREARRQSKPLSVQLRAAERRVKQRRNAVATAKTSVTEAEEAAKAAELAVKAARDKVTACEKNLAEAEQEEQRLLRQRPPPADAATLGPVIPECVDALSGEIGDDQEAQEALQLIRQKLAARITPATSSKDETALAEVAVAEQMHGLGAMSDMDVDELERQVHTAKRRSEEAEERFQAAKSARRYKPF